MRSNTVLSVTLSRLIGLAIFLILLIIANILYIPNSIYSQVINFLNNNLGVIILISVLLYLGELFFIFAFPFNLPAPIFNAFGGVFLIVFLFRIFYLIGNMINNPWFFSFDYLKSGIYLLIFFLIIIFGYVNIFMDLGYRRQKRIKGVERYEDSMERKKSDKEEFIDWNDFRDNLKKTLQDIPKNIKESLESKEEKKKPKRKRNE